MGWAKWAVSEDKGQLRGGGRHVGPLEPHLRMRTRCQKQEAERGSRQVGRVSG